MASMLGGSISLAYSIPQDRIYCDPGCRCHVKMGTPYTEDPGSPYSWDYGDPGPHFPGNMGTRGPQFNRENGDPFVKITVSMVSLLPSACSAVSILSVVSILDRARPQSAPCLSQEGLQTPLKLVAWLPGQT